MHDVITTMPECRDASSQNRQYSAKLQQQLDSAQADLGKAASQVKQQQDAKGELEQQLQQLSQQLAARQQENTQVRRHLICLLTKSQSGQAAELSRHQGTWANDHMQYIEQVCVCLHDVCYNACLHVTRHCS